MANRYWVGGSGTWDASSTTHWSATSGGSGGASVPGSADIANFDANSGGGVVTLSAGGSVPSGFKSTGFTGNFSGVIYAYGAIQLGVDGIYLNIPSGLTATLTSNGKSLDYLGINNGSTLTCADSMTVSAVVGLSVSDSATLKLKAGATSTIGAISNWPSATIGVLQSDTAGTRATLSVASGTINVSNMTVTDIAFAGGATWYWGAGSVDGGNNTGISSAGGGVGRYSLFMDVA